MKIFAIRLNGRLRHRTRCAIFIIPSSIYLDTIVGQRSVLQNGSKIRIIHRDKPNIAQGTFNRSVNVNKWGKTIKFVRQFALFPV